MIERHQFGNLVKCFKCGQQVDGVWAFSWKTANDGEGLCDDCYAEPEPPKTVLKNKVKPVEDVKGAEDAS